MKKLCLFPLMLCCMAMKPGLNTAGKHPQQKRTPTKSTTKTSTRSTTAPAKEEVPKELQSFTDDGLQITRWQYGDLDADGNKRDALILLADTQESEANFRDLTLKPRTVKVLIRSANGKLKEVLKNDHCLAAKEEGGASGIDPFGKFIIKHGDFTLAEQSGFGSLHSEIYTTFRYDGTRKWNLEKRTEIGYRDEKEIGKKTKTAKQIGKTDFEHYKPAQS